MTQSSGEVFARLGGEVIDPPVLMDAAIPLELSGEAVRARLCIFSDQDNRDVALRPDLTLPLAVQEVAFRKAGDNDEKTVRYAAKAFRLPSAPGDQTEFVQVGCERYGLPSTPKTDAELFGVVTEEIAAAGIKSIEVRLGDLAIFDSFVSALDVPASVRAALKRAFREDGGIKALFSTERVERTSVARRLRETSAAEARATVKEMMDLSGVELIGTRTLDEIVTRLVEQAKDGDIADVPEEAQAILLALTELDVPALEAAAALTQLTGQAQLSSVGHQIERLAERITAMTAIAPGVLDHARFSTSFGRRFTYYDGFVFEIGPPADPYQRAFGAGGRYDRLLDRLSDGQVKATAIGAVIRPDRIAALGRS
ncbi:MAG: ATP phosphoribosyltransferase regulatory subunit [Pseudomonadota bacterium]